MNNFIVGRQLAAAFARSQKYHLDDDCCILVAADRNVFAGLQLLYHSLDLSHEFRMELFDLGLTAKQRAWVESLPNVRLRSLKDAGSLLFSHHHHMWQTWNKPLYFKACDHKRVLWLDTDCVVSGDLRLAFERLKTHPVLVKDPADSMIYKNGDHLYKIRPVKQRLNVTYANGGIVGLAKDRDDTLLSEWIDCIREASRSDPVVHNIKWFDQGCLNWAIERLGVKNLIWHDPRFCVQGAMGETAGPIPLIEERLLRSKPETVITHFAGWQKPWGRWKDTFLVGNCEPDFTQDRITVPKLKVFLLWHDDGRRSADQRWYHHYVNLSELPIGEFQSNAIAETRAYMADLPLGDAEYVGFCTARWNDKYRHAVRLSDLHHLRLSPKVVWAAERQETDWISQSDMNHPGMVPLIKEMASEMGLILSWGPTLFANNFICHRDVFEDLKKFIRKVVGYFHEKYHFDLPFNNGPHERSRQAAYFYERATMLYFANRSDLLLKQASPRTVKIL